jgi:fumarate reductase flavoprotein subunit
MLLLILACTPPPDSSPGPDSEPSVHDSSDSSAELGCPEGEAVDLLVIGAGPAGLFAALRAQELGASVQVWEMLGHAGEGLRYPDLAYAVGTSTQADHGIEDSLETALLEWEGMTGSAPDEVIEAWLGDSAGLMAELESRWGVQAVNVGNDPALEGVPRLHELDAGRELLESGLLAETEDSVRTLTRADHLCSEGGAVVGALGTDLDTGEELHQRAHAVIIASGGFAWDFERMRADRPGLAEPWTADMHEGSQGLGHAMAEELGAASQNQGHFGVYLHALLDPDHEGNVLGLTGTGGSFLTGTDELVEALFINDLRRSHEVEQGLGRSVILWPDSRTGSLSARRALSLGGEVFPRDELIEQGLLLRHDSLIEALAAHELPETYSHPDLETGEPVISGALATSASKAFTGLATDPEGRVLDLAGDPIPGLYGAGEAIGMLGTPAVGVGFPGSITAVLWSGARAGESAVSTD